MSRFEAASNDWYTPPEILERARAVFGGFFGLDPCTSPRNPTGAQRWFTRQDNGLAQDWTGLGPVWCNPPYAAGPEDVRASVVYEWIEKAVKSNEQCCLCLTTSQRWSVLKWHYLFFPGLTVITIPRKRIAYLDEFGRVGKAPPYPTMLFWYLTRFEIVDREFRGIATSIEIGRTSFA